MKLGNYLLSRKHTVGALSVFFLLSLLGCGEGFNGLDSENNSSFQSDVNVDFDAFRAAVGKGPTLSILQPKSTNVSSGTVNIQVDAVDPDGVKQIKIYVGSTKLGADSSAPYAISVNTSAYAGSTMPLRIIGTDKLGNQSEIPLSLTVSKTSAPTPTPTPTPAPTPTTGTRNNSYVDFYADFESNKIDDLFSCSGNCPIISSGLAFNGKYAMRSQVTPGMSNQKRSEVVIKGAMKKMEYEKTYWIGFSLHLAKDWKVPPGFEIPFQIHQDDGNTQPALAIYTGTGNWRVKTEGATFKQEQIDYDTVLDDRGIWTTFVVQYKPSYKGSGIIKVWKNGILLYTRTGNTADNYLVGPYVKFGIYKGTGDNQNIVYHDDIRMTSNPNASYKDVAP